MLSPRRSLRLLVRRVPALAWRDAKMLEWREKYHQASEAQREAKEAQREANEARRQASGRHHRASEALKRSRAEAKAAKSEAKAARSEAKAARSEAARLRRQLTTWQRGQRTTWQPPTEPKGSELIMSSGLFDASWYLTQLPDDQVAEAQADPLGHYLQLTTSLPVSAHPLFLPAWWNTKVTQGRLARIPLHRPAAALLHYLTFGAPYGKPSHPAFDAVSYALEHPDCVQHPGGAMGHLIALAAHGIEHDADHGDDDVDDREADAKDRHWTAERARAFLAAATDAGMVLRASRGFTHLPREQPDFDFEQEQRLKAALMARDLPGVSSGRGPLVSIVLPTKDRADSLAAAIDSVLQQTYQSWELLVVDDGSTDHTLEVLQPYLADDRLVLLRHDRNLGVSAARNTALRQARGTYVAYLDSNNAWLPDFLELMVRFLLRDGHRVGYAATALVEQGGQSRRLYQAMPFCREALLERNFIDCPVLVHERALLEETGMFDESLRRTVDWDLFIRMSAVCDFGFAPFVAMEYDPWEQRGSRITMTEPLGYRFVVLQRTLVDWDAAEAGLGNRRPDLLSVVIVAKKDPKAVVSTVRRVRDTAQQPLEIVLVDNHMSEVDSALVLTRLHGTTGLRVHRLTQGLPLEVARNVGASVSTGTTLAFLLHDGWPEPGWDLELTAALQAHPVVQPLILTAGGSVWSAGASFTGDGQTLLDYRGFAGDAPEVRPTRGVVGATAACMALSARSFVAARGFDPMFVNHHHGAELSLRVTAATQRAAACVGTSKVALGSDPIDLPKRPSHASDNERMLADVWRRSGAASQSRGDGLRTVGYHRPNNARMVVEPLLVHDRSPRPLRWALKIGAPTVHQRSMWGDWHFALALQAALESHGQEVTIDCQQQWYRPSSHLDDVVVSLHGLGAYQVSPGSTNVCWVISHPDNVSVRHLAQFDLVFGASSTWCQRLAPQLARPPEPLLQCTDPDRFAPVAPDPAVAEDVLVVANARRSAERSSIKAALAAGLKPAVYGTGWEGRLPPGCWKGSYLPNDRLAVAYASAGVVLSDHWSDMREHGFLSNRLFDLAACAARAVSDDVPGMEEVFGSVIRTYRTPQELSAHVANLRVESPQDRAERLELSATVRREHNFAARAATLTERVLQHRAGESAPGQRGLPAILEHRPSHESHLT